jgi:hypothetical protein
MTLENEKKDKKKYFVFRPAAFPWQGSWWAARRQPIAQQAMQLALKPAVQLVVQLAFGIPQLPGQSALLAAAPSARPADSPRGAPP